jgi:hypothetical protein
MISKDAGLTNNPYGDGIFLAFCVHCYNRLFLSCRNTRVGSNLMTPFKLTIFLTILSLFSCKTNNKQIIAKWDNGKPKIERVYSDPPNCFIEKNYYDNGQLSSETKFIDSTKNGESIAYYKDG